MAPPADQNCPVRSFIPSGAPLIPARTLDESLAAQVARIPVPFARRRLQTVAGDGRIVPSNGDFQPPALAVEVDVSLRG